MIDTTKITELKKTNRTFPESDKINQGKNSPSKENAKLGGDAQRAESEIPTDAIGRMNGALRTWMEVAEDNIINKAELARLRKLATADPQNDIYHSFLEHVANSVQQKFDATPRPFLFRAGLKLKLRACQETISLITEDRRCIQKYTFSDLLEEFGRVAPKLEPAEEVKRFKVLKAMVDSGQASVLTLLVDASRFKQAETIKATLVLMMGLCRTPADAELLHDFSAQVVKEQGHREQLLTGKDLAWAFAEACRQGVPLETLSIAHRIYYSHDFGPTLIVKHRALEEGDFEKIAAGALRDDRDYIADREVLNFAAIMQADLVFSPLERLLDRKDLTPAEVDQAVEIAQGVLVDGFHKRLLALLQKAMKRGLLSPEVLKKAAQKLDPGPDRDALLGITPTPEVSSSSGDDIPTATNLLGD